MAAFGAGDWSDIYHNPTDATAARPSTPQRTRRSASLHVATHATERIDPLLDMTANTTRADVHPIRPMRNVFELVLRLPSLLLVGMVRLYQWTLSPLLGRYCRFEPTCSQYFIESVQKYGAIRGALRGIWRIIRCNPWTPGGYDPP